MAAERSLQEVARQPQPLQAVFNAVLVRASRRAVDAGRVVATFGRDARLDVLPPDESIRSAQRINSNSLEALLTRLLLCNGWARFAAGLAIAGVLAEMMSAMYRSAATDTYIGRKNLGGEAADWATRLDGGDKLFQVNC